MRHRLRNRLHSIFLLIIYFGFVVSMLIRKVDDDTYEGTTWQIKFQLHQVDTTGVYKLRLALATVNASELQVNFYGSP